VKKAAGGSESRVREKGEELHCAEDPSFRMVEEGNRQMRGGLGGSERKTEPEKPMIITRGAERLETTRGKKKKNAHSKHTPP